MTRRVYAGIRARLADPLYRSAVTLMANTVVTSTLGVVFWIVVARTYAAEVVGRDGALIASMITLSTIAQLSGVSGIWRFLPRMGRRTAKALLVAYGLSAAAAVIVSVTFVVAVPRVAEEFRFLREDVWLATAYVLGMVGWSVVVIGDAALTALGRTHWLLVENALFALAKLVLLPLLLLAATGHGIYLAWVLPVVVLLPVTNALIFRRAIPAHVARHPHASASIEQFSRRRLLAFLSQDYAGTLMSQGAHTMLPVLVVGLLGSRENAYFFVAWTVVFAFDLMFLNVATSLTVEGAIREDKVAELARNAIRRLIAPLVGASLVLIAIAPVILVPFGPDYTREAAPIVRLLACASVFRAVLYLFSGLCRLHGRGRPLVAVEAGVLVGLLSLSATLAPALGLKGVALAWLITHGLLALVVARPLRAMIRRPATYAASGSGDALADGERPRRPTWAHRPSMGAVIVALIGCLAAPVLVALDAPVALRLPAVLLLFTLTPGIVLCWPSRGRTRSGELGLVVATSLAVATVVAQAMLWLDAWHPTLFLFLLAGVCAIGLSARLVSRGVLR
jgi:O-antigen/teichoic acid export membrane protein